MYSMVLRKENNYEIELSDTACDDNMLTEKIIVINNVLYGLIQRK